MEACLSRLPHHTRHLHSLGRDLVRDPLHTTQCNRPPCVADVLPTASTAVVTSLTGPARLFCQKARRTYRYRAPPSRRKSNPAARTAARGTPTRRGARCCRAHEVELEGARNLNVNTVPTHEIVVRRLRNHIVYLFPLSSLYHSVRSSQLRDMDKGGSCRQHVGPSSDPEPRGLCRDNDRQKLCEPDLSFDSTNA